MKVPYMNLGQQPAGTVVEVIMQGGEAFVEVLDDNNLGLLTDGQVHTYFGGPISGTFQCTLPTTGIWYVLGVSTAGPTQAQIFTTAPTPGGARLRWAQDAPPIELQSGDGPTRNGIPTVSSEDIDPLVEHQMDAPSVIFNGDSPIAAPAEAPSSLDLLDNAPNATLDGVDIDGDKIDDTIALGDAYNYRFANQGLLSVDNVQGSSGQQIPETKISVLQALTLSSKTDWVVPQNFLNNFNPSAVPNQEWAQAIVNSGLRYGIPPEVLAAQLDEESAVTWDPTIWTNQVETYPGPGDDGRGLGQFLPGTWNAIMPEYPVLDPTLPASHPDLLTQDPRTNPLLMIEAQARYDRQIINALKDNPQVAALGLTDVQVMLNGYNGGASYEGVVNGKNNNSEYGGYHNKVLQHHLPKFQLYPGSPPVLGVPR